MIRKDENGDYYVAPLAGAWIETMEIALKYFKIIVAPLAGAWIETLCQISFNNLFWSHPSRVRGLKHLKNESITRCLLSHPSRVRGLKPAAAVNAPHRRDVAPLAGAWIETL